MGREIWTKGMALAAVALWSTSVEKRTSGANARCGEAAQRILNRLMADLKSCPDTKRSFSCGWFSRALRTKNSCEG
jgi:hypothetical protein